MGGAALLVELAGETPHCVGRCLDGIADGREIIEDELGLGLGCRISEQQAQGAFSRFHILCHVVQASGELAGLRGGHAQVGHGGGQVLSQHGVREEVHRVAW